MKILITGGHFSPAYSVIEETKNSNTLLVVGRRYAFEGDKNETFEYKLCKREGIPFQVLKTGRLQRKLSLQTIPSLLKIPSGMGRALLIVRKFKPDVIVTFGGYIGLPIAIAGYFLKIPVVLHEQTQNVGLSASLISRIASVVCISFESSRKKIRNKQVILTGNPIRSEFFKLQKIENSPRKPFIYITGGSTGSHAINEVFAAVLPKLLEEYTIIHQIGNSALFADLEMLKNYRNALSPKLKQKYILSDFFTAKEVAFFFQNADLVISRSGVNTVLELMASRAVSILIPLPYGQTDEQKQNALLYEKVGLGRMLEQKDLAPESLISLIHAMIKEREDYLRTAEKVQDYIFPDATARLIAQIYKYGERRATITSSSEKASGISI